LTERANKVSVDYHHASTTAARRCGNCRMFFRDDGFGRCTLVAGTISEDAVCDKWEKRK
jgi:hypothetical protein